MLMVRHFPHRNWAGFAVPLVTEDEVLADRTT